MPRNVRLDDIVTGIADVDAAFVKWREAIEGAHAWDVRGSVNFVGSKDGYALHVKGARGTVKAIADGAIPARVSDTEDGEGLAVLYDRTPGSPDRTAGETVTVYNPFDVEIPDATTIVVAASPAGDYEVVSGDCVSE